MSTSRASTEPTQDTAPPSYEDDGVQATSHSSTNKATPVTVSEESKQTIPVSLTIQKAYIKKRYSEFKVGMMWHFPDIPKDRHCEAFSLPIAMTRAEFLKAMEPLFQKHFSIDMKSRTSDPKHGELDAIECRIDVRGKGLMSAATLMTAPDEPSWQAAKQLMQNARGQIAITFMYACSDVPRSRCIAQ